MKAWRSCHLREFQSQNRGSFDARARYFLRGRGPLRFLDCYLRRGGWRDGRAGFHYSMMIAMYEYWIEMKIAERENEWHQSTKRLAERLLQETPA